MDRSRAPREGGLHGVGRERGCRRVGRVESIGRGAVVIELGDRQRGRRVGRLDQREVHVRFGQPVAQDTPETVVRQPTEERDLATEPPDGPRGVERPAAGNGREASVGLDEDVDEGLAGDDDHATHRTGATYAGAMDRLTDAVELLDGPLDDPPTLAGNLRDLRRINRWLGGVRLSADAIDALAAHRDSLTVLDVGTGGADIPMALLARADKRGRGLSIVGIDSRPEVLTAAVTATPAVAATSGLELHVGDGRSLPYGDGSFDVVHSSLVIHHLSAREAVVLLREMARVARLGVVVNDLDRTRLGLDRRRG